LPPEHFSTKWIQFAVKHAAQQRRDLLPLPWKQLWAKFLRQVTATREDGSRRDFTGLRPARPLRSATAAIIETAWVILNCAGGWLGISTLSMTADVSTAPKPDQ
jgi:hypothetical protein